MPGSEDQTSGTPTPPQTTSGAFWTAAELGSGLIELDRAECLELLAAKFVGRIAYVGDTGPRILPVNYILG
ncbi:MAG TPA: pyridoxamine 5'-phosphate oxidase family protein, partial [Propionibacteriaceae bacterium]|nr:pyridoxamine 5'-phosphate oxidase family protein [Propionibacteriaceae bacterium]